MRHLTPKRWPIKSSLAPWDAWLISLCVLSLCLAIAVNPRTGFANGFNCDSWYFFGIYRHYFGAAADWQAYQLQRYGALVPWIFIAPFLDELQLSLLRFWSYFLISLATFVYTARTLMAAPVVAVGALIFGLNRLTVGALSTDYLAPAGMAITAALLLLIVCAARWKSARMAGLVCGAFAALALSVHLPIIIFIATSPLLFFSNPQNCSRPGIIRFMAFSVLGVIGLILGLIGIGLFSLSVGHSFFFLLPALVAGGSIAAAQTAMVVSLDWILVDSNAQLLALGLALSTMAVARISREIRTGQALALARLAVFTAYAGMVLILFVWEASGLVALRDNVYAPFGYPLLFLTISLAIDTLLSPASIRARAWICVIVCFTLYLIYMLTTLDFVISAQLIWIGIILATALFAAASRFRSLKPVALFLVLGIGGATMPPGYGRDVWNSSLDWRQTYEEADDANDFVARVFDGSPVKFWVASDMESVLVPRTFLYCSNYAASFPNTDADKEGLGHYFPGMSDLAPDLSAGDMLIVLGRGNVSHEAVESLERIGVTASEITSAAIDSSDGIRSVAALRIGEPQ